MKIRSLTHIAIALAVVFALGALPAAAGGHGRGNDDNRGNDGGSQTSGMSAEQAASIVRGAYGGRVVSVKPSGGGYNVRVLLDGGRVKTVQVDANGRMRESN
jgi:uncharacterized membrane protein YkoI